MKSLVLKWIDRRDASFFGSRTTNIKRFVLLSKRVCINPLMKNFQKGMSKTFYLIIVGIFIFCMAVLYLLPEARRSFVGNKPIKEVCRLSDCWGSGGCNYIICSDGTKTYEKTVPADKPFDPKHLNQ